ISSIRGSRRPNESIETWARGTGDMSLETDLMTILWRNGLIAIPIALAVVLLCRCVTLRPSTRHALWLLVLASFLMPPALHSWWNPVDWRASFAHAVNEPPQA